MNDYMIEETSVPNRRRRKASTAISAVAALAVASPFAVVGVMELTASPQTAPEHREFVSAAVVTDPDGYRWVLATFKKLVPFSPP